MAYPFRPRKSNDVKEPKKDKKYISPKTYLNKPHTHRNTTQK